MVDKDIETGIYIDTASALDTKISESDQLISYDGLNTKIDTIIHIIVSSNNKAYFEDWLIRIYEVLITFKGFRGRHVHILSSNENLIEYTIILAFDDIHLLNLWLLSNERAEKTKELVSKGIKIYTIGAYGSGITADDLTISDTISNKTIKVEVSSTPKRLKIHDHIITITRPLPPAKWKLTIITISMVYITIVVVNIGGSPLRMRSDGLPTGVITFFTLLHIVPFLMYALIPLFMSIPIINYWLRIPRSYPPEEMHPIHSLLDQGLQMFANKNDVIPMDILQRLERLEVKIDKLRSINHNLNLELRSIKQQQPILSLSSEKTKDDYQSNNKNNNMNILNDQKELHILHQIHSYSSNKISSSSSSNQQKQSMSNQQQQSLYINDIYETIDNSNIDKDNNGSITIAVKHFIKWECIYDFEIWTNEMDNEMKKWPGYGGMIRIAPKSDGDPFINSLTWNSYSHLLAFSNSNIRSIMLMKLEPMLEATSQAELGQERVFKDAFSELFIPTGATVGARPPPIWKTMILTVIPLTIIVWSVGNNLSLYFIKSKPTLDFQLQTFFLVTINVTINNYVGVPLMTYQFGKWLNIPRHMTIKTLIFRYLDSGFPRELQFVFVIIYFGLNLISRFLK